MTVTIDPLAYYSAHHCALFPIPAGSKAPGGIIKSFKHDYSTDPEQWKKWAADNPGCNFGIVAFASKLIIVDVDITDGQAEAWNLWADVCKSWGLPGPLAPQVQSARGGWHVYIKVPDDIDPASLRQPDAIKGRINIRTIGYTVAAGSTFDNLPYLLFPDAPPPHPAPAALIEHCSRSARIAATSTPGGRDKGDVAGLLHWLNERNEFDDYATWCSVGMALKIEYGDDGLDLWRLTHNETVTPDIESVKWASFATEPTADSVTLSSFLDRANKLGWRGTVRKSASSMFGEVAQIAAAAGASLPGGMPMLAGQEELTRIGTPILETFLAATNDAPHRPASSDYPCLPPAMAAHGLYNLLNRSIARVFAMADPTASGKWKSGSIKGVMAVLLLAQPDVHDQVRRRIEALGRTFPTRAVKIEAKGLEDEVQRAFVKQDDWIYDARSGLPESDNPDNVVVFLAIIGAELRQNVWLNRTEIKGFEWRDWVPVDDVAIAKLKVRALRTGTRFRVGNEFLKETLTAIAHDNPHDPVAEHIDSLKWDGQPRLSLWLSMTCGVPCDLYHQAVSRNVIGGMVRRVRKPGAKHDEVMILMGPQGTLKSTLCRTLAMDDSWFTDSVTFDGSPQNVVPQLFGKLVVELAELDGMARKEVQSIKRFISAQSDNVTLKYKAFASEHARRCIFIGTSNEDSPLVDVTGNRRFLPVRMGNEANVQWLRDNIEQIIAEAAHLEAAGADFSIPRDIWTIATAHQESARSVSDMEMRMEAWFGETTHTATAYILVEDLAELFDMIGWRRMESLRNAVLKKLRFNEIRLSVGGQRKRAWYRGPEALPKNIERMGAQYVVSKTADGRPRVTPRLHSGS